MKVSHWIIAAALGVSGVVGCDEGSSTPTVESAQKAAGDAAQKAGDQVAAAADKAKEVAAQGFDAIKTQVEDLYNKGMALVNEKKFTDAKAIVDQLMAYKDKVPAEWQTKLADLAKKVEEGIKAMGGGH